MNITTDMITIVGWIFGGIGLVLLAFELRGDRARGRARCRRCWYNLRDITRSDEGWLCPECGTQIQQQRQLTRTRRRWNLIAIAVLLLATPAGLHAGRAVQNWGWACLLPDWVLVRLPIDFKYGVTDGHWSQSALLVERPEQGTVEWVILRRMPTMDDANRRLLIGRVQRYINSGVYDPPTPQVTIRAYDVQDIIEPSDWLMQWMPYMDPGCCSEPFHAMHELERRAEARADIARSLGRLAEGIANFDGTEPRTVCRPLEGLLVVAGDADGHARLLDVLEQMRSQPDRIDLGGGRSLAWFDAKGFAVQCGPYDDFGFRVRDVAEDALMWLTDAELWAAFGPGHAVVEVCGESLAVIGPPELLDDVLVVSDWLVTAKDGERLSGALLKTTDASAIMLDMADVIQDLRERDASMQHIDDEWAVESILDALKQSEFIETLYDSNADYPALIMSGTRLIVSCSTDYEPQIRAELRRIRTGEVLLEF